MDLKLQKIATEVFEIESKAILSLSNQLTIDFDNSINAILASKGKLIISGMGKSGIIGTKIAATLASTGTPSFFLHPGEAYHGDLGTIEKEDILLLLSNSGETDEVLKLIPFLKFQKNITISMTGNPSSTLADNTNYHLNIAVEKEACPLQLAPTSSTTATLAMGDALAVALMKSKDFKDENFAMFHPGGSLGRRLITKVSDIMKTTDLATCNVTSTIKEVVHEITSGQYGLVVVLEGNTIKGIVTDGDIRRSMEINETNFFNLTANDIMSMTPKTLHQNSTLTDAQEMMSQHKINSLIIIDDNSHFLGVIQMHDLGL